MPWLRRTSPTILLVIVCNTRSVSRRVQRGFWLFPFMGLPRRTQGCHQHHRLIYMRHSHAAGNEIFKFVKHLEANINRINYSLTKFQAPAIATRELKRETDRAYGLSSLYLDRSPCEKHLDQSPFIDRRFAPPIRCKPTTEPPRWFAVVVRAGIRSSKQIVSVCRTHDTRKVPPAFRLRLAAVHCGRIGIPR